MTRNSTLTFVLVGALAIACAPDTPAVVDSTESEDSSMTPPTAGSTGGPFDPDPDYCVGPFVDDALLEAEQGELEAVLIQELNRLREEGATCGGTTYAPGAAADIQSLPQLACAARRISFDTIIGLGQETFLNTEGEIRTRVFASSGFAGFTGVPEAEFGGLYAGGFAVTGPNAHPLDAPLRAVRALMELSWSCHQIMDPSYTVAGAGVVTTELGIRRWTVVLSP